YDELTNRVSECAIFSHRPELHAVVDPLCGQRGRAVFAASAAHGGGPLSRSSTRRKSLRPVRSVPGATKTTSRSISRWQYASQAARRGEIRPAATKTLTRSAASLTPTALFF